MHFGGAVELGNSSGFLQAAFEVGGFGFREGLFVGLDEVLEGLGGLMEEAVCLPGWQLSVGLLVQEVVLQASLDLH